MVTCGIAGSIPARPGSADRCLYENRSDYGTLSLRKQAMYSFAGLLMSMFDAREGETTTMCLREPIEERQLYIGRAFDGFRKNLDGWSE